MRSDRPIINPSHMPPAGVPTVTPVDLGFFINAHQYLQSIPQPSEVVLKAKAHLEEQISKAILAINIRIGPAPPGV
jgi:hypothetical protein